VPSSMGEALEAWESSAWIGETFGQDVQDHYTNMARIELAAYGKAVTDWERYRNFERI
jgi:glutamine synthetase